MVRYFELQNKLSYSTSLFFLRNSSVKLFKIKQVKDLQIKEYLTWMILYTVYYFVEVYVSGSALHLGKLLKGSSRQRYLYKFLIFTQLNVFIYSSRSFNDQ